MKIAMVEDDKLHRKQISEEVQAYFPELDEQCELRIFHSGLELLDSYNVLQGYDLLLLDIVLPGIDGLTVARHIREIDEKALIVFLTHTIAYAVQGYSVRAPDYILKPINRISFRNMLDHVRQILEQRAEHYITVSTGDGLLKLDISQIYYIETERHAVRLHYTKGSFHVNDTMKGIEAKLQNASFFRCNNCYLVNLAYVQQVKKDVVIVAGHELAFSRTRYRAFMEVLTNYIGGAHQ